jgi:hypothetical protein
VLKTTHLGVSLGTGGETDMAIKTHTTLIILTASVKSTSGRVCLTPFSD